MTGILTAAGFFAFPPLYVLGMRLLFRLPLRDPRFFTQWASSGAGGALGELLGGGAPAHAAACGASGLLALIRWWWSRRKRRKRSLKALGEKMRAVFEAMAKNTPRPGPVVRPAPQGAHA